MLTPLGQMRDVVVIMSPTLSKDEMGGELFTYTESDPVFIALRATTTREAVVFKQVNADVTHIAFGHWCELSTLNAKDRIRVCETGQEFDLSGPPINDPNKAFSRLSLIYRENEIG